MTSENFDFNFVTFRRGFLLILFGLQFVSLNYFKRKQKTEAVKSILNVIHEEKLILRLTFNPGVRVNGPLTNSVLISTAVVAFCYLPSNSDL